MFNQEEHSEFSFNGNNNINNASNSVNEEMKDTKN